MYGYIVFNDDSEDAAVFIKLTMNPILFTQDFQIYMNLRSIWVGLYTSGILGIFNL